MVVKIQQKRAIQRMMAKKELLHKLPMQYRDEKLRKQDKKLRLVGNAQDVPTLDVAKKMRSELLRSLDRDKDETVDLFLMRREQQYSGFIQFVGDPQLLYLWSKKQLNMLRLHSKLILKKSRNTLFLDGTGSVIHQSDNKSKRVFLYSFVAHVPNVNEKLPGILLPIAEAFLSSHTEIELLCFFLKIQAFCHEEKLPFPFTKRICVDWSLALIMASVRAFNKNINSLSDYLLYCFNLLRKKAKSFDGVVVQICCSHMYKIVCRDLDKQENLDERLKSFCKSQFGHAINISSIEDFFNWFRHLCVTMVSRSRDQNFNESFKALSSFDDNIENNINLPHDESKESFGEEGLAKSSPFYKHCAKILTKVKSRMDE